MWNRTSIVRLCALACLAAIGFGGVSFGQTGKPTFTIIDAPGAGPGNANGTYAGGVNDSGSVADMYLDSKAAPHGFVRSAPGVFTTFDVEGYATQAIGINVAGTVFGIYSSLSVHSIRPWTSCGPRQAW